MMGTEPRPAIARAHGNTLGPNGLRERGVRAAFQVVVKRRTDFLSMGFISVQGFRGLRRTCNLGASITEDRGCAPEALENLPPGQARSKRSRFITLSQAATKSFTNFSFESAHA